ncbi:MAG: hypothetical protein AABY22_30145 [Nanoarchaeota archaeon]
MGDNALGLGAVSSIIAGGLLWLLDSMWLKQTWFTGLGIVLIVLGVVMWVSKIKGYPKQLK